MWYAIDVIGLVWTDGESMKGYKIISLSPGVYFWCFWNEVAVLLIVRTYRSIDHTKEVINQPLNHWIKYF